MGRKLRGAALRAKKRSDALALELEEGKGIVAENQSVKNRSNLDLFVIDTKGHQDNNTHDIHHPKYNAKNKRKNEKKKEKPELSELDEKKVQRLLETHGKSAVKLQQMAQDGEEKMKGKRHRKSNKSKAFDLWDEKEEEELGDGKGKGGRGVKIDKTSEKVKVSKTTMAGTTREHVPVRAKPALSSTKDNIVAIDVAHSGQSYLPDPKHHQTIIQEAIKVELRREEAEEKKRKPLSRGLSKETKEIMLMSSESEDSDSGDESDDNNSGACDATKLQKRTEKLTRAKRNKQKRLRAEEAQIERKRKEKKLMKSLGNIPRIEKELKAEKRKLKDRKQEIQAKKGEGAASGSKLFQKLSKLDPINAPTLPVALPEELQIQEKEQDQTEAATSLYTPASTLRTIKPKGSLLTERMASFVDRSMVAKRKFGEKKMITQGKKRKVKMHGKGYDRTIDAFVLG